MNIDIGIDVDGVLSDFNASYVRRQIDVAKVNRFPAWPFEIPTWNYPEFYGYTTEEIGKAWASIKADHYFWQTLYTYPDTNYLLNFLGNRVRTEDDNVYFITNRLGVNAKRQTEEWLDYHINMAGPYFKPTVLLSAHKGLCARALELDVYVDDKWENCLDVATAGVQVQRSANRGGMEVPRTTTFLRDQPWNRLPEHDAEANNILRITDLREFGRSIDAMSLAVTS